MYSPGNGAEELSRAGPPCRGAGSCVGSRSPAVCSLDASSCPRTADATDVDIACSSGAAAGGGQFPGPTGAFDSVPTAGSQDAQKLKLELG